MIDPLLLTRFTEQFDGLKAVVSQSESRTILDEPDQLFLLNQNVFVKSYLVSACSILEAFIQDLAMAYVDEIQNRINGANIPFNFIIWLAANDKAKSEFKCFRGEKTKQDIEEMISPNYWKTMKAFDRVGINLEESGVEQFKDEITTIVQKRNRIVHHNDEASDISFGDVVNKIDLFKDYCQCLFLAVSENKHIEVSQ